MKSLALRGLFRSPVYLYRWKCGWLLGHRFLLLVHTGRRSGRRRETVLEVMRCCKQPYQLIVMSGFGRNADWLLNIQANRDIEVLVGTERFAAGFRFLDEIDAVAVVAAYERRNRIASTIVRAVLTRLVGWRYDGSDAARRRLVAQLPLIAFAPLGGPVSRP